MAQSVPETPILISEEDSTRALIANFKSYTGQTEFKRLETVRPGGAFVLFVTNLQDMLQGEGANAFRAYAEDGNHQEHLLRVEEILPMNERNWVYAVRVRMQDNPGSIGDVLVRVTWRGMSTNRVRVGVGKVGGGPADDESAAPTPMPKEPISFKETNSVTPRNYPDIIRFMQQATFGPSPELEQRLRRIGITVYLGEQFSIPVPLDYQAGDPNNPFNYPNLPLMPTNPAADCTGDCQRDNYTMYQMRRWFYRRALYGQDQLRHRMAWALLQIVVTASPTVQQPSWMVQYQKILDANAFGNYRTLLRQVTLNPAMGDYLDMVQSTRTNPNENYARELMQLFSIGLFMLDVTPGSINYGNPVLDGQGLPIPTYTQTTVDNLTKVLTGWRLRDPQTPGVPNYIDPMRFSQSLHDKTAKTLLVYPGSTSHFQNIAANQCNVDDINGNCAELDQALENIYYHPNIAPFICKNLIQHLVTSDPTPAFVERISNVFNAYLNDPNQLRYVLYAILIDPEARGNVKNDPKYGLLREPVLYITNILRQFKVKAYSATPNGSADCNMTPPWTALNTCSDGNLDGQSAAMSQSVYASPTVFNFYPPDYIVPNTSPPVLGPEFAIYTTSTSFRRVNFVNSMFMNANTGFAPSTPPNTNTPFGTSISTADLVIAAGADTTGNQLMDVLNEKLMQGRMSSQMRSAILTAVTAVASSNSELRAETALYLVLTSSQYQVQK